MSIPNAPASFDFDLGVDYQQLARDMAADAYPARLKENGFRVDYLSYGSPFCLATARIAWSGSVCSWLYWVWYICFCLAWPLHHWVLPQ